ncbi:MULTISPECIES: FAD-dependent oxidoreductase [Romboutsia]|uniref:Oxidoreductase n=2 Tax=Romboutsia hominis TaxID=1507512 RepID=A0A2P2BRK0_9FIRM|nr:MULTISPECIES: FAD-dependent oxidoreductase [Romboutsia]MCH1960275.1 FAD-dependent oxidoreductase [Romboutsia hominis]MDB8805075.1 FAD-dependent oxidoreductase [Romboutsia sp. 1001216sp1]MDB8808065.1 FAD-dependent oxidoreductase [Romboutsia sp. 1001216sp1]MDB8810720.1 FAD-dependent oxidoreductase [Romboutsia sp. 1001216sp1]MDB8816440.1 FAD-dependent oxidoreductase [Romboutsia sp. 1001216sp1]
MNESYWILSSKHSELGNLEKNIKTNILIVGGGIVGVTTAYLLAKNGLKSTIVDANKIGYGGSGRNTGKITSQHGIIYSKLNQKYGIEDAKLYYEGNNQALNLIEKITKEHNIDCNLKREDSYILAQNENYLEELKEEYEICKKIGIDCEYHKSLDLPVDVKGAISFKNQCQFNPKKYIDGLLKECINLGVKVYENTPIVDFNKGEVCELRTNKNNKIFADIVVIASHMPWYDGKNLYFAKEKGGRSYLIAGKLEKDIIPGMFLGVEEQGITFRTYNEGNRKLLIFGGGDHKVGQCKNEEEMYEKLKNYAKDKFKIKEFKYQWSAQDYMSYDYLPYIGYINKKQDNVYVATGFSKWGMSNGTLSAIIISDLIAKKESIYENLFNPSRKSSYLTTDFYKENLNMTIEYIKGKFNIGKEELYIEKGEGQIVTIDGKRYGAYRHLNDELYIVDITCTHLGCELRFNSAEKTWDCPCHASRYDYKGNVLEGPTVKPLKRYGEGKNHIHINLN